jgi:glucose-1-phosphate thymidylyltransferase
MTTKGIILAGGSGSRLWPVTSVFSKHFIPIYDKPMIYYPLTTLMLAGIRDILIISTPEDLPIFKSLLQSGEQWGLSFSYETQSKPNGLAEALIIADKFLGNQSSILVLGDNLVYGPGLGRNLVSLSVNQGATITAYQVAEPEHFGVVVFDNNDVPVDIVEKPSTYLSDWAIPGIYFFDNTAPSRARCLQPSARGEIEISELNRSYLIDGSLNVHKLARGTAWLDLGTPKGIQDASTFVRTIQERQGLLIGSPEDVACSMGYLSKDEIFARMASKKSLYAKSVIQELERH